MPAHVLVCFFERVRLRVCVRVRMRMRVRACPRAGRHGSNTPQEAAEPPVSAAVSSAWPTQHRQLLCPALAAARSGCQSSKSARCMHRPAPPSPWRRWRRAGSSGRDSRRAGIAAGRLRLGWRRRYGWLPLRRGRPSGRSAGRPSSSQGQNAPAGRRRSGRCPTARRTPNGRSLRTSEKNCKRREHAWALGNVGLRMSKEQSTALTARTLHTLHSRD
eukprot:3298080-Pleurochrysis_carterae.AAC.5